MKTPGFSVIVPASTANLGPGFDSIGLALNLYMNIHVSPSERWEVFYDGKDFASLAAGEDNLIVTTIKQIAQKYKVVAPPLKLVSSSNIPLGKGLGSSASAIAAGIVIADHVLQLNLTDEEKVLYGSQLEGHADNITAALLGGAVISYYDGETIDYIHVPQPKVGVVMLVPPKALATEASRGLLPDQLRHKEATRSSSAGAVLSAAIVQQDWEKVGRMMEKDRFHEPYRKSLFPDFDAIREVCRNLGAYGMTISGAGPSLLVTVEQGKEEALAEELSMQLSYYECLAIQPSTIGAVIEVEKSSALG